MPLVPAGAVVAAVLVDAVVAAVAAFAAVASAVVAAEVAVVVAAAAVVTFGEKMLAPGTTFVVVEPVVLPLRA